MEEANAQLLGSVRIRAFIALCCHYILIRPFPTRSRDPTTHRGSQSPSMVAAWDIYAKELTPLGYGYPLWGPEPCPQFGEVRLGDVGYLREGHFCFLFSTMLPADHPTNAQGVPSAFDLFDPPPRTIIKRPFAITQPHLLSKSLRSISVSTSASAGYA